MIFLLSRMPHYMQNRSQATHFPLLHSQSLVFNKDEKFTFLDFRIVSFSKRDCVTIVQSLWSDK